MQIPRKEYPRPQFVRSGWLNLNGQWQFEIDNGRSGEARGLSNEGAALSGEITVPFCPESKLSGVGHTDFMCGVWYKRTVTLDTLAPRTLLHFGAVDYHCKAFVNGNLVGEHKGGYVSFAFDITSALREGENEITVYAEDDTRDRLIPSGKQSSKYGSYGCYYTRTTGIWQTVWLEFTAANYVDYVKYFPNVTDGSITVEAQLCGKGDFTFDVSFEGKAMGSYSAKAAQGKLTFTVDLAEKHLWEVGHGRLYDVAITFGEDKADSYFGLREVRLDGYKFLINGKSVFQRLVLDQGFYPDGIYTAPSDEALVKDIQLSLNVGFNGARLHEKIFEERFLYHADKMGYLVWGEYPDWGLDHSYADNIYGMLPEWMEEVKRDFNHPAIVGWCPHNETWNQNGHQQHDESIGIIYDVTKAIDTTRPCIDTSGNYHVRTDIFCVHDYNQDPVSFKENYDKLMTEGVLFDKFSQRQTYRGEATFLSEYGGIRWIDDPQRENDRTKSWGYGNAPQTEEEFKYRFKGLTDALLDNNKMFGLCYTQLTDVEQEQNGIYTYDRREKFESKFFYDIMSRKAAIED
ncbi:MAG: beta-galactosidase [Clostridia bacterium]|nr:beta-galactosidase [Clostridia bacterium]